MITNFRDITPGRENDRDEEIWDAYLAYKYKDLLEQQDDSENIEIDKITKLFNRYVNNNQSVISEWFQNNSIHGGLENMFQLLCWYRKCESFSDYYMLTRLAYKLVTGRSLLLEVFETFFPPASHNLQSDFEEGVKCLRQAFDTTQNTVESPLMEKFRKMYAYIVVQGFLKPMDLDMDQKEFHILEKTYIKKDYTSSTGMLVHAMDLGIYLCEKLVIFRKTGDVTTFIHNTSSYEEWFSQSDKLISLAPFTSNLAVHGTTYFTYLSDLNDTIEKGIAISRFSNKNNGTECIALKRKLMSLQMIKNTEITRKSALKERKAPFGVLIHGHSSVAKSSFTKMLFYYYASLFNLENGDHYKYTRTQTEFWDNFDSSKWCIQLDDIAFMNSSRPGEVDPTLKDLLNVVNNVPYVPPQAALEDKGKTPVLAELVLATTNAADLNAHDYFHCPLAVRRRLPFVVHVEPKPEYMHENGMFINPASLPESNSGFPDYWIITVQRLVPERRANRDWARLEDVQVYNSTSEFLKVYGNAAREHIKNQEKSMNCDDYMRTLRVCNKCLNETSCCTCEPNCQLCQQIQSQCLCMLQSDNIELDFIDWLVYYVTQLVLWIYSFSIVQRLLQPLVRQRVIRYAAIKICLPFFNEETQVRILGFFNKLEFGEKTKRNLMILSAIGLAFAGYSMSSSFFETSPPRDVSKAPPASVEEDEEEEIYVTIDGEKRAAVKKHVLSVSYPLEDSKVHDASHFDVQGNMHGTVESQLAKEADQNVWYNPTIDLTNFDMPVSSTSLTTKTPNELRDVFSKNLVHLTIYSTDSNHTTRTGGVMLVGQICLINYHTVRHGEHFKITVTQTDPTLRVNSNITFDISRSDMIHKPDRDLTVFLIKSLPPYKDIFKFWVENDMHISRLCMLKRDKHANVRCLDVHGVRVHEKFPVEVLGSEMDMLLGKSSEETRSGDCGSLAIGMTPRGPVLCGIHTVGHGHVFGVPFIKKGTLSYMIDTLIPKHFIVQGCGGPKLGIDSEVSLLTPHHKSLVRYLEAGSVNIYGTLPGFRPRPKSKVCKTPLSEEVCTHFGVGIKHDKPAMTGWEPWRQNLVQMVAPVVTYDRSLLKRCVKGYFDEIMQGLPEGWEKELLFLSNRASINGLPGVKFIDKMNTNTSMGFPWNTTKKQYLHLCPDELYPDGVDFDPEVWQRVDDIKAKYARGERAFPVFVGHLKDEATPKEKCKIKKTRLFAGGPVDWSLVVRSRLLTFVRLVQKNSYVFESGPGMVAQSEAWDKLRQHLTQHGAERMVAGDYKSYDKGMIADFILAAFEFICMFYERAGFAEEEIREIFCIGNDIAFPLTNINGDILEFFGTNPSGHPLTVIINGIVNSLYMRYAFGALGGSVEHFKIFVALFTYGDDNVMGVSERASFFTHTTIQSVLATIGVRYTMADKGSASIPYIHIDSVSFLKRTWRLDEDIGCYVCPLEEESIHRSLTVWLPSGTINSYEQMVAVIVSANNEYFFYGKEIFNRHNEFFRTILKIEPYSSYVTDQTLPTWQELYDRFWRASGKTVQA